MVGISPDRDGNSLWAFLLHTSVKAIHLFEVGSITQFFFPFCFYDFFYPFDSKKDKKGMSKSSSVYHKVQDQLYYGSEFTFCDRNILHKFPFLI